jgi:hypothetical protein
LGPYCSESLRYDVNAELDVGDTVRTAAEKLFVNILEVQTEDVCQYLVSILRQLQGFNFRDVSNPSDFLLWDSLLLCIGLASSSLCAGYLDMNEWLANSLAVTINEVISSPTVGAKYT